MSQVAMANRILLTWLLALMALSLMTARQITPDSARAAGTRAAARAMRIAWSSDLLTLAAIVSKVAVKTEGAHF